MWVFNNVNECYSIQLKMFLCIICNKFDDREMGEDYDSKCKLEQKK